VSLSFGFAAVKPAFIKYKSVNLRLLGSCLLMDTTDMLTINSLEPG